MFKFLKKPIFVGILSSISIHILCESDFKKECVSADTSWDDSYFFKNCKDKDLFGKSFYSIRPQNSNTARRLMGLKKDFQENSMLEFNENNFGLDFFIFDSLAYLNLAFEYQRSFDMEKKLARWFSFNDKSCMTVGIPGDSQTFDIDGNQIGITTTGQVPGLIGTICMSPKIMNLIFDIDLKINLEKLLCGLWMKLGFPIVRCKTSLNLCEKDSDVGANEVYRNGFMSNDCTMTKVPYTTIIDAFNGLEDFGAVEKLEFGKFPRCSLTKTALASVDFDLGYDFISCKNGYLNVSLHGVAPTGNRPKGVFVFEPIVGANKSWQVGAEIEAAYCLCNWGRTQAVLYFDTIITHLFKAKQSRIFGLRKNGPGSQYLLLKNFNDNIIQPAANVLTGETKIGADCMLDGSLMFHVTRCNWFFELGYNYWLRTREKRSKVICLRDFEENKFGIKGDLNFSDGDEIGCSGGPVCIPNTMTASGSTIGQPAAADEGISGVDTTIFLKISDIDTTTPLHPSTHSNKIFGSIGYSREKCNCPWYILFGGEVEFGTHNKSLSQFGLIAKFGISV